MLCFQNLVWWTDDMDKYKGVGFEKKMGLKKSAKKTLPVRFVSGGLLTGQPHMATPRL